MAGLYIVGMKPHKPLLELKLAMGTKVYEGDTPRKKVRNGNIVRERASWRDHTPARKYKSNIS